MENTKSETTGQKPINNQDRFAYYRLGEKYEDKFVQVCQHYEIDAEINPEKKTNPYAPDIIIYFWRGWEAQDAYGISVPEHRGAWWLPFKKICELIDKNPIEHFYQQRINDDANAKSSYILNAKDFKRLFAKAN